LKTITNLVVNTRYPTSVLNPYSFKAAVEAEVPTVLIAALLGISKQNQAALREDNTREEVPENNNSNVIVKC
jgi:hypothetical protein